MKCIRNAWLNLKAFWWYVTEGQFGAYGKDDDE